MVIVLLLVMMMMGMATEDGGASKIHELLFVYLCMMELLMEYSFTAKKFVMMIYNVLMYTNNI